MAQRNSGLEAAGPDRGRTRKDTASTRRVLELIRKVAAFEQGLVVSMLPRGGVKLLQPANLPVALARAYDRFVHSHDLVAWSAILHGRVVRGSDCWSEQELSLSLYHHEFLRPSGWKHSLAVPLSGPVLAGYPGAVVVLRSQHDEDFSEAEMSRLQNMGGVLDEYLTAERPGRAMELASRTDLWTRTAPVRCFIFSHDGEAVFPKQDGVVPARVEKAMHEHACRTLDCIKRGRDGSGCVDLPDERGENWAFRFTGAVKFPALGDGPVVFASLQPEAFEWGQVRPWEVAADEELARILPAMKFMQQEFASRPSLDDIASRAKFSQFHFHRRFTDLVGRTPKQFLVSCQMHHAKRLLVERRCDMARIASDCGFSRQSHFTSRFTQTTGLTPTRWRRAAVELVRDLQGCREGRTGLMETKEPGAI
ncbi:MAG: AraC family transcriptional regulator [Tepidisphaeraceae bacterium]|jgi:AraC-like DNA-binding protein